MKPCDRRSVLTGLAGVGASAWLAPSADALGLGDDKIKAVRYFSNSGDAQGRRGQPMVNQSTNVVIIETEGGLRGIGEGGEPTSMDECASMLIGQDPFRIDQHWQRMLRGYFYPAGREKIHSLGALDMALWDLKAKALGVPLCSSSAASRAIISSSMRRRFRAVRTARSRTRRARAWMRDSAAIVTRPTIRASVSSTASSSCGRCTKTA